MKRKILIPTTIEVRKEFFVLLESNYLGFFSLNSNSFPVFSYMQYLSHEAIFTLLPYVDILVKHSERSVFKCLSLIPKNPS